MELRFCLLILGISLLAHQMTEAKKRKKLKDMSPKAMKERIEKMEKRQEKAWQKFKKLKKANQLDRRMGKSTLRTDRHGGKLMIQRKGQYFEMKIKEIVERYSNSSEVKQFVA